MSAPIVTLGTGSHALPNVPVVGFGAMGLTAFYGPPTPGKEAINTITKAYDGGVRHFDTAELYNSSFPNAPDEKTLWNEVIVGLALKDKPRDSFTVATKFFPGLHDDKTDAATVAEAVESSLRRLNLGHIDLYYLHRVPATGKIGLLEWLEGVRPYVERGLIKAVGLSEAPPAFIKAAHEVLPIAAVQQEWSLLTRDLEKGIVPVCKELGIGIVAYSPLNRSLLGGSTLSIAQDDWRLTTNPRFQEENLELNLRLVKRIEEIAAAKSTTAAGISLKWLLQRARDLGVVVVPIPGSRSGERAVQNFRAAFIPDLSEAEMEELNAMEGQVAGLRGSEWYMQHSYQAFE